MALRQHLLLALCMAAALAGCGCSQKSASRFVKEGHPFVPPDPVSREATPLAPVPKEEPIVQIISGTAVSGPEEALQLLDKASTKQHLGLRTSIEQLTVTEVPLMQVAATLSEMSGYNIAVTRDAAETPITMYLRELPLRQALETICRLYDLWYREDERIVTLMTTAEYTKEMIIRRNEKSRAFWLRYTNANDMAKILQAVMSSKVVFNDIGSEEVYGHVDEDKKGGESINVKDEDTTSSSSSDSNSKGINIQGFDANEIRQLLNAGPLGENRVDALDINRHIDKDVPAVITVFKRNNAILARSLDETVLQDIGRIIELMDTPTSQVLLEIAILQINLAEGFESFFNLDFPGMSKYSYPDSLYTEDGTYIDSSQVSYTKLSTDTLGVSGGLAGTTLNVLFGNSNIQAQLELYAKDDRVNVVSTPFLMSANNSKVEFFVGEEVPLRDDVESNVLYNDDGNVTTTSFEVSIKREELGTDIEISSFINEDGTITMNLDTEISSPQYNMTTIGVINDATGEVVNFPIDGVETEEMTSIVTAASGQTIALGGTIREEIEEYEEKVPILGDIPGLGFFFRSVQDTKKKVETVILLTPHIIRHPELAGQVSSQFLEKRSSHPRFTDKLYNILDYNTGTLKASGEDNDEPATPQPTND